MLCPFCRVCPMGTTPYTIKSGDSYATLAQQFNTTVAAITAANPGVNPSTLHVGQIICIPMSHQLPPCPSGIYYTIKAGDTVTSIARFFNISVAELLEANPGLNPNMLVVGRVICIPRHMPPVACPPGTTEYIVRAGDTLESIARRFNTTVRDILRVNPNLDPGSLRVGQKICIPRPVTCPAGTTEYIVKAGDTLHSIARRFNTTVRDILRVNPNLDPGSLRVGQKICIPRPVTCPAGTTEYIVKAGDTLQSIARRFNTTVRDILRVNPNLDPGALRVGQRICIPGPTPPATCPPGTTQYIVKAGDTLQSIAKRFDTSVGAIIQANPGVLPNNLYVGQKLCIPGPKKPRELEMDENEAEDEMFCTYCRECPAGTTPYTIKAGDTFVKLAQQFHTTVAAITAANPGVNPNALKIGQAICMPTGQPTPTCPEGTTQYTIKAGDTFTILARKFNTTVEAIRLANPNVNPSALVIGQKICIPAPVTCPVGSQPYVVKAGDTFFVLARRFGVTVEAIRNANPNTNPNALHIGDTICIPSSMNTFTNAAYNVSFMYPANWHMVEELRYEGSNGFFQIAAISSTGTLDEVCHNEAFHLLRPYGSNPTITHINVQGHDACLILPSADQPAEMRMQAAVIVKYPKPVEISGQSYNYFVLWADKNHIREIASTLRFLTT